MILQNQALQFPEEKNQRSISAIIIILSALIDITPQLSTAVSII